MLKIKIKLRHKALRTEWYKRGIKKQTEERGEIFLKQAKEKIEYALSFRHEKSGNSKICYGNGSSLFLC